MNRSYALVLVAMNLFGMAAACAAPPIGGEDEPGNSSSSASRAKNGEEADGKSRKATGGGLANATEVQPDGGIGTTLRTENVTLTVDGRACNAKADLDMGLGGTGWTAHVESDACGLIVAISGLDDQPYPQSGELPAYLGDAVLVFTGEDDGSDAGASGTYRSGTSGASITSGPKAGTAADIVGSATVTSDTGKKSKVTFDIQF